MLKVIAGVGTFKEGSCGAEVISVVGI